MELETGHFPVCVDVENECSRKSTAQYALNARCWIKHRDILTVARPFWETVPVTCNIFWGGWGGGAVILLSSEGSSAS